MPPKRCIKRERSRSTSSKARRSKIIKSEINELGDLFQKKCDVDASTFGLFLQSRMNKTLRTWLEWLGVKPIQYALTSVHNDMVDVVAKELSLQNDTYQNPTEWQSRYFYLYVYVGQKVFDMNINEKM